MVLRVRLLEVGGSTGGALGKAFFPFTFFCGTGAAGGGAKRSTSESDAWTSFFFRRGQKRIRKGVKLVVTGYGFVGEGGGQNLLNVYLLTPLLK